MFDSIASNCFFTFEVACAIVSRKSLKVILGIIILFAASFFLLAELG